jgi:DNA-binding SARP family transcriptional activator
MYDFVPPSEDICFSNSMVLDPEDRSFYALSFSVIKYDGFLQLVKGSLQKPDIQLIASKIPYSFHDVNSFSSLYFCKSSKKLIAATMLVNNQNQTEFNLYSISFPPNELLEGQNSTKNISSKWIYISGLIIILVFSLFIRKYLSKRKKSNIYIAGNLKVEVEPNMKIDETDLIEKETFKNSIFFFGGFQVFNSKGSDITNRFSPLLKELFLLIWLNSIKIDKGISSEKLTELLWFDKDEKSANNNRAVNIAKLKQILSEIDSCTLSHKTTYWKIDFAETIVYNDYFECLRIIRSKKLLTKEKVYLIIDLSRKGGFLLNLNYEWLDDFKSNISNAIIDVLSEFALKQKIEDDPDFILHLADSMFNFDIVNEDAMMLKCKALTFLGKHSLAANTYSKFAKDYKILYDQHYRIPFTEIVT